MPRLNTSTGSALMGIAGGVTSIDGAQPALLSGAVGGNWGWKSATVAVGPADFGSGYGIWEYNTVGPALTQVDSQDWNGFAAGGGVWAAFWAGRGVRTSVSGFGPFLQAGLADVSEDGQFGFIQNYQADSGLQFYNAAGTLLSSVSATLTVPYVKMRDGLVAYQDAQGWHLRTITTGLPAPYAPRTVGTVNRVLPVVVGSVTYVVEWVDETLTLRPATSGQGYLLLNNTATPNALFNPDAVSYVANTVRVGYSTTLGENPTNLRLIDVTLGTGATSLGTAVTGAVVFSAGPTATPVAGGFPVGPVEGGTGSRELQFIMRTPIVQPDRMLTREWWDFFNKLSLLNSQPIALGTETTGVLPPAQGGTGGTGGLTEINGANIIGIIPPAALLNVPNVGYWTLLTHGDPLHLEQIVAQAGHWSPVMSGPDAATSTMVLTAAGDAIMAWEASGNETYLPPFVDDGSGAPIALFVPVTGEAIT